MHLAKALCGVRVLVRQRFDIEREDRVARWLFDARAITRSICKITVSADRNYELFVTGVLS